MARGHATNVDGEMLRSLPVSHVRYLPVQENGVLCSSSSEVSIERAGGKQ